MTNGSFCLSFIQMQSLKNKLLKFLVVINFILENEDFVKKPLPKKEMSLKYNNN